MRGGIIAVGIILLIFGVFLYFTGNNMVEEVEKYDVEDIPISEILKLVSEDARRQYEMGQSMITFGTIFGIIGFILCITGIAAPSKKPQILDQQPQSPVILHQTKNKGFTNLDRRCPDCGRVIPEDAEMCPYCGKRFKTYFTEEVDKETKREEGKNSDNSEKKTTLSNYCTECGFELGGGDHNFCPNCGNKLK